MTFPSSVLFREIHKNAWLRKLQLCDKKSGAHLKKGDRVWAVFCIHDDTEPYIELYGDSKLAAAHKPEWSVPLTRTLHISSTICAIDDEFEFVITLPDDVVRLGAPTWEVMNDWVDSLTTKLREMRILSPKENVYSRLPELKMPLLPTRDPNSPLPLPPAGPSTVVPGIEPATTSAASDNLQLNGDDSFTEEEIRPTSPPQYVSHSPAHSRSTNSILNRALSTPLEDVTVIQINTSTTNATSSFPSEVDSFNFSFTNGTNNAEEEEEFFTPPVTPVLPRAPRRHRTPLPCISSPRQRTEGLHEQHSSPNTRDISQENGEQRLNNDTSIEPENEVDSLYEHVFLPSNQLSPTARTGHHPVMSSTQPVNAAIQPQSVPTGRGRGAHRPRRRSVENPPVAADRIRALQPPPNPFRQGSMVTEVGSSRLTLREHQVLQLRREIMHPGGVRLQLRRKDCLSSIALVDVFNAVWIAGWKQKEHPMLYNALHIGDQLISIAGILVQNAIDAQRLIKGAPSLYVEFVIRRVPCGRVFALRRESEGQHLGIILEGNTAEVKEVTAGSIAASSGLSSRTPTYDGLSLTTWVITEVNGRPLNLFFKDGEIKDRLNAVGLDISLLVQPFDLIKQIKKQLKSIRSYKDYIVQ